MARIVLFLASFAFMVWAIAGQVEQQSLHRGSVARYGSFRQIPHRFLNATPVASSKVPDGLTCADSCLQHERCWSYNLRARPDGKGQYDCQLLATDRYSAPAHMEESLEFNHHSLMVSGPLGTELKSHPGNELLRICRIWRRDVPLSEDRSFGNLESKLLYPAITFGMTINRRYEAV